MTLLHIDGLDSPKKGTVYSTTAYTFSAGRTGNALVVATAPQCHQVIPSLTSMVFGFAFKTTFVAAAYFCLINSAAGSTTEFSINFNALGQIEVRKNAGGTILATGNNLVVGAINTWYYVEVKVVYGDSGSVQVKLNGNQVLNATGIDIKGLVSSTMDSIQLNTNNGTGTYDDFYVCDMVDATATQGRAFNDFLGPIKIERLLPNANGTVSQFVGSDGNSVDNYLLVDEPHPFNTTDYVASSTNGQRDLYNMGNIVTAGTVYAVDPVIFANSPDSGSSKIKAAIKDPGGTVSVDAGAIPGVSFDYMGPLAPITKDPLGVVWSTASVNAAEIGVEINT